MLNSNILSIKSLRSNSLFDQPIMVDGIIMNEPIIRDGNDLWDLTHIFDGTPDWEPQSITTRKIVQ